MWAVEAMMINDDQNRIGMKEKKKKELSGLMLTKTTSIIQMEVVLFHSVIHLCSTALNA